MASVAKNCPIHIESSVAKDADADGFQECTICLDRVPERPFRPFDRHIRIVLGRLWLCTSCVTDDDVEPLKDTAPKVRTCWAQPNRTANPPAIRSLTRQWTQADWPRGSRNCASDSDCLVRSDSTPSLRPPHSLLGGVVDVVRGAAVAARAHSPAWLLPEVQRPPTAKGSRVGKLVVSPRGQRRSKSRGVTRHEDHNRSRGAKLPSEDVDCQQFRVLLEKAQMRRANLRHVLCAEETAQGLA
eukprot:TRINITY_DN78881_c0_g1_i1.p1 TRINITY_DN78881_c0_g1~~TRINITY_DN78881_c0_g1_i1.p1  ORF type:complete len:242 (+),score=15.99 TRINITY_DN78881_c0_g1_i1:44-769(+)